MFMGEDEGTINTIYHGHNVARNFRLKVSSEIKHNTFIIASYH
jgi:hypothetical protein